MDSRDNLKMMEKKHHRFFTLFLILLCWFCPLSAQTGDIHPVLPTKQPDRIVLNVTENIANSMAVTWRTSIDVDSSFAQLALADAHPAFGQSAAVQLASTQLLEHQELSAHYHSVIFENLQPNTQYAYRVGQEGNWSEWFHFTTAGKGLPLDLIYFGDVQTNIHSLWSRTIREAYRRVPDARAILYAGDLVNRGNRDIEWGDWFLAGGFIHASIPSMPTPGNHDHADSDQGKYGIAKFWQPQFALPRNGPENNPEIEETCYFSDIDDVRIITLNTEMFDEKRAIRKAQVEWLEQVLATNPKKWTMLLIHHPVYSTKRNRDNPELRKAIKPLLDKYKVDLVLQGHDHTYVRGMEKVPMDKGATSGTAYVVSVSGPKMSDVLRADWMDRVAGHTQLFHTIRFEGDVLTFQAFTTTGELYDCFELHKVEGSTNRFVDRAPVGMAERH